MDKTYLLNKSFEEAAQQRLGQVAGISSTVATFVSGFVNLVDNLVGSQDVLLQRDEPVEHVRAITTVAMPYIRQYLLRSKTTSLRHSAKATDHSSDGLRPSDTLRVSCAVGELISFCTLMSPRDGKESVAESRDAMDWILRRDCAGDLTDAEPAVVTIGLWMSPHRGNWHVELL